MSIFIISLQPVNIKEYPGHIIMCHYDVSAWSDSLFLDLKIHIPTHIITSTLKRRANYLAGRFAAATALKQDGITDFTLLNGKCREPLWPDNISGSLSHCVNHAICAIHHATGNNGVGIDIEQLITKETANEIWGVIINYEEKKFLANISVDFPLLLTMAFSAKESLFKALYPYVKFYFGFESAIIVYCNMKDGKFILELTSPLTNVLPAGRRFTGYFRKQGDTILTFIYFEQLN